MPPVLAPGGDPNYGPPPGGFGYGYRYGPGPGPFTYVPLPKTNGLAVASFVCSFFFWLYGLGAVLAIVFGFIARSQIKRSEGQETGGGLALAGIIIGGAGLLIGVVGILLIVALVHHCDAGNTCQVTNSLGSRG